MRYLLCISPVVLFFTCLYPVFFFFLPCEATCIDHGLPCLLASYWIWLLVVTFGDGNSESEVRKLYQVVPLGQFSFDCEEHFATAFSIGCLLYITVSFWALINASSYLFGLQDCKSVCVCGVCGVWCMSVCVCVCFKGPLQIILEFSSVDYVISFLLRL